VGVALAAHYHALGGGAAAAAAAACQAHGVCTSVWEARVLLAGRVLRHSELCGTLGHCGMLIVADKGEVCL